MLACRNQSFRVVGDSQAWFHVILAGVNKRISPVSFPSLPTFFPLPLLVLFLKQGLTIQPWLTQNLLCRQGWPLSHRDSPTASS